MYINVDVDIDIGIWVMQDPGGSEQEDLFSTILRPELLQVRDFAGLRYPLQVPCTDIRPARTTAAPTS